MNRKQLIKKYVEFFKKKGHKEIANVSLIPENDPTVLFTTAGMHPLVPYLLGQKHPSGKNLVNVQRCIRTQDIDEVGDAVHLTFFEMLGNWSLGDYWKKEVIEYSFEFLSKVLGIPVDKLAVSCFKGDKDVKKDTESSLVWAGLGFDKDRIAFLGRKDNWWGPAGKTGPCGPDTEIFYWGAKTKVPKKFDSENNGWVEIWNDVLMEYEKGVNGKYSPAKQKNIDTGMGVERTVAVLQGLDDVYKSDNFLPIIRKIEKISGNNYKGNEKAMRIIADHVKASVFIVGDGVVPGNIGQGYILRRLIRRAVRHGRKLGLSNFIVEVASPVFEIYDDYKHLKTAKKNILRELENEEKKFLETLEKGIKMFDKMVKKITGKGSKDHLGHKISGEDAFLLYQSYGFPIEMVLELGKEKKIKVDDSGFLKESKKHQELSRTASKGKFASGLADEGKKSTKLHTATHLLHAALRKVLGGSVQQKGSNITSDRLRFDFSFDRKLTDNEIKKIEDLINGVISKKIDITSEEMSPAEAKKSGALGFFGEKYGDKVLVYSVGKGKGLFSKEICTGPHIGNTSELGKFKIVKEESSSAGVRRIKAVLK